MCHNPFATISADLPARRRKSSQPWESKAGDFAALRKNQSDYLCLPHDNEKISGTGIALTLVLMGAASLKGTIMATSIAINGFGRIGRLVLRTLLERYKKELAVVAINDMADLKTNAHLFRYDSTYGIYPGKIELGAGAMKVDGRDIAVLNQKEPARGNWSCMRRWIRCDACAGYSLYR
jgi:hypothetical protein